MITLTKVGSNVKYEGIEGLDTTSVGIYQEREITIDGENVALSHGRVKVNTVLSNLEIGGTTPTTEAEFWTAVEAVFPNPAGSGSSTPSYVALLTQSGTDAPAATVLENSTGETPSLAYVSEGNYDLVFAQTLDEDATSILIQSLTSLTSNVCAYWLDANTIRISTLNGGGSFTDGLLSKTTIQIKIY
jgi:hypothetical protein